MAFQTPCDMNNHTFCVNWGDGCDCSCHEEPCRICRGGGGKHDGAAHDAYVADQPLGLKLRPGDQQLPVVNAEPDIQSQVIADIEERRKVGIQRYGTALQPNNGRDAVRDLYEELIDGAMYAKQWLIERERLLAQVAELQDKVAQQDAVLSSLRYGD